MVKDPGVRLLSRYVARKLEEVATRYENLDEWGMVEITHKLPEWQINDPGDSSQEIPLAHILEAVGPSGRPRENSRKRERGRVRPSFFHGPAIPGSGW